MSTLRNTLTLLLGALCLAGCSGEPAVYNRESFSDDSPFRLDVDVPAATGCDGARRALLGQGYLIEKADAEQVKGRKAYRSEGDQNTFIEVNVVCVGEDIGSTLYANGVLSTYDLKKSSSPASVGVSAIGSISLPIGRSADSLVKIAEETIDDPAFYQRFFGSVKGALQAMRARTKATEPASAAPAEKPAAAGSTAGPPAEAPAPPAAQEPLAAPGKPSGLVVETTPPAPATAPEPGAGESEPEPEPLF